MSSNTRFLFFIFSLLLTLNSVFHIVSQTTPSDSDASYILACGASTDAEDTDGRTWKPDSQFLSNSGNSMILSAHVQDPSLPSTIPYMTARIFTSTSTYKILVAKGKRFWLRLHFYSTSYGTLDPSKSYLDVIANGFTLLHNFSASITAQALTQVSIMKEFSLVPAQSGDLDITFKPTLEQKDAYAFVNGIEVIPMPDIFKSAPLVGYNDQFVQVESSSFQTIARLNVGGQFILPTDDSGLTRTWYDDSPYIFSAAFGVTYKADKSIKIQYPSNVSKEIAPLDVYNTARFHFCELDLEKVNQRVFNIFVNNQTAKENADVIEWAESQGVPVYKDYAVYASDEDLWVALHPSVSTKPQYYDAILNGLEIFKMNDTRGNLAGPNPVQSPMPIQADDAPKKFRPSRSERAAHVIGGISGGVVGCAVVAGFFICFTKEKRNGDGNPSSRGNWLPLYGRSHTSTSNSTTSGKSIASSQLSSVAAGLCRHFSLSEIKHGTKNFSESQVIGVGGFGKVYEGLIDGKTKVAIKRSNPSSEQGLDEFLTEIEMLSRLRHKHLVSLIGFCEEDGEMILGILEDIIDPHLKGKINPLSLRKFTETAEKCVADQGLDRPTMGDVLWNLEFSLQLEKTPEQPKMVSSNNADDTYAMYTAMSGTDEDSIVSLEK
ncbi:hypothetical protein Pint_24349 [Pistacia integerrima]|uniref:Uncharacterized protein n=1 Tax=Pistacia integerrima TaxID=434235 RepID=A0ACC0YEC0_9ROSI|nr:hypothetical protein Pint_24349 [Pistacia integerrima]